MLGWRIEPRQKMVEEVTDQLQHVISQSNIASTIAHLFGAKGSALQ